MSNALYSVAFAYLNTDNGEPAHSFRWCVMYILHISIQPVLANELFMYINYIVDAFARYYNICVSLYALNEIRNTSEHGTNVTTHRIESKRTKLNIFIISVSSRLSDSISIVCAHEPRKPHYVTHKSTESSKSHRDRSTTQIKKSPYINHSMLVCVLREIIERKSAGALTHSHTDEKSFIFHPFRPRWKKKI